MDKAITVFWALRFLIGVVYVLFNFAQMAGAVPADPSGQGPGGTTCALVAIPATSTVQNLVAPSAYVTVVNTSSTTTLYFSPNSPATVTSFPIMPNSAYSYAGVPLSKFYVIGSAASGNYGVIAH